MSNPDCFTFLEMSQETEHIRDDAFEAVVVSLTRHGGPAVPTHVRGCNMESKGRESGQLRFPRFCDTGPAMHENEERAILWTGGEVEDLPFIIAEILLLDVDTSHDFDPYSEVCTTEK